MRGEVLPCGNDETLELSNASRLLEELEREQLKNRTPVIEWVERLKPNNFMSWALVVNFFRADQNHHALHKFVKENA